MTCLTCRSGDRDPSPALSWWDKLRYVMHGRYNNKNTIIVTSAKGKHAHTNSFFARLLFSLNKLKFLMHTTLDPYNTTEEVELALTDAQFDWTNAGGLKCGVSNLRYDQVIHYTQSTYKIVSIQVVYNLNMSSACTCERPPSTMTVSFCTFQTCP